MSHEFLSITSKNHFDAGFADAGIMTNNGTAFNGGFLAAALPFLQENSAANQPWFPFDRGIQVPTPTTWDNGVAAQWGLFFWNRNEIIQVSGVTGEWVSVLTVTDQENLWDYGIHTGLYEVYGDDGQLYVCGIYPGTTSNAYTGAIKYDVENNVWSDTGELNLGGATRFTNCQYCIAWKGELLLFTQKKIYRYNPASDSLTVELFALGDTTPSVRLLVLGQRLFACIEVSSRLKIYENIGGFWVEMADLGQIFMTTDGMFDYIQTETQAIFFFNSVETIEGTPMSGYRAVEVTTFDSDVGGALILDEVTSPVLDGFANRFHADLNSYPDVRFWSAADGSSVPFQSPQINLWVQEDVSNVFDIAWQTFRWVNKASQIASLGAYGGGNSYSSSKTGGGGTLFSSDFIPTTQRKIVVYKIEPADDVIQDGMLISFWAFGNLGTGQVKIYVNYPTQILVGSLIRVNGGTIFAVITGGTLFGFTTMNNVPVDKNGGGVHQFVWDRNTDNFNPWQCFGLTVDLSD